MLRLLLTVGAACTAPAALAAQTTSGFGVSTSILSGCTVSAVTVAFGSYTGTVASPTVDTLGQITVTCSAGNGYDIRLNSGSNQGAGGQRRMLLTPAGGSFLSYELYSNSARTQRWGNNNAERMVGTGTGAAQQWPVYARLPGAQIVPFGTYRDTITVTVQY